MNFWRKDITEEAAETRADVIIQKKKRKQDPQASGLGAVAIPRRGKRAIHQRNEDRHYLEGTTAKALIDGIEHEVKVINLSSNGVMIGYEGDAPIGATVRLAIDECAPITTAVRWGRRGRVGLEFIAETVIIAEAGVQDFIVKTIARERAMESYGAKPLIGAEQRGIQKRHPLVFIGKLRWKDRDATARLRNISKHGAMVAITQANNLASGDEVRLSLAASGEIAATIRWIAGQHYGLEFAEEFDVSQLAHELCAELVPPDDARGLRAPAQQGSVVDEDSDSLVVRMGKVENPHQPPEMHYERLTLDELYATLYPHGRPGTDIADTGKDAASEA